MPNSPVRLRVLGADTNAYGHFRASQEGSAVTTQTTLTRRPGATFGIGSLPHRNVSDALDFVWSSTDIPTIPSLPRRSPAEGMIAQALVGIEGVSVGQYGGISVDVATLDVDQFITTDLSSDAYGAFSAFLETFNERNNGTDTVKWQFVGPVTLGVALVRIGLEPSIAFPLALQAVRAHVSALEAEVAKACGNIRQIIMLDEPNIAEAFEPGFYLGNEEVIDLVSGALAVIASTNVNGLHCCAHTNWAALLSTGANVLSVPMPSPTNDDEMGEMLAAASRISDHLAHGGRIAWGAVRTDGPIAISVERPWKSLVSVMCSLVKAGVDPLLIRRMSYVTPACGLGTHTDAVAERVFSHVRELATRVGKQSTASLLTLV
jgi:hypothetical protein